MKYSVRKWNSFKFIIHPDKLVYVLEGFSYVVTSSRSKVNENILDGNILVERYHLLYDALSSGKN